MVAATLSAASAISISTMQWSEDSPEAFNVLLTGTGMNWKETFTSPSGLWELTADLSGNRSEFNPPELPVILSNHAFASFQGNRPLITSDYISYEPAQGPLYNSNSFLTIPFGSYYETWHDWKGVTPYVITSIPELCDNSTWTWVYNIYARGPSLITKPVPESGGVLCLAFATGLLLFFRPRKQCLV